MLYADSVTKSFLNAGARKAGSVPLSQFDDYQDPTYLGFQFRLVPSINAQMDLDDLPHGLFTLDPVKDPYSCYNYLMSRGETKRAEYIILFETAFKRIVNDYPWYFVKISGLADSWKIDTKNNYRGKEKKIVIETLESIDMRMTMIMDLYRKAVWDSSYMRWAVPDHMRYFRMEIIVSEIRPMKISSQGYENSGPNPGVVNAENTNFEPTVDGMKAKDPGIGLWDTAAPWSSGTFIAFRYSECELDVFAEAPAFLESVGSIPEAPAANKITIHTHVIHEKNVYGLLGAIVDDTKYYTDYVADNEADYKGGAKFPANPNGVLVNPAIQNIAAGRSIYDYVDGYNERKKDQASFDEEGFTFDNVTNTVEAVKDKFDENHKLTDTVGVERNDPDGENFSAPDFVQNQWNNKRKPTETAGSEASSSAPPGDKKTAAAARDFDQDHKGNLRNTPGNGGALGAFGNRLAAGAIAAVTDIARSAVNKALLGNVYGVSPLSLIGSAQSILNNPAAAIEAILRKHSTPSIGTQLAKQVQLTGQEIQLVKSVIGASTTGAEDNVKVNPDLVKNQGKVNQTAATLPKTNPGKTNLSSANINTDNPGKVNLRAPSNKKGSNQKTNLTAFAGAGSNPGKVEFESPTVLPASVQKEELIQPNITPEKLGNVELEGAPVEKGNLGKTDFK